MNTFGKLNTCPFKIECSLMAILLPIPHVELCLEIEGAAFTMQTQKHFTPPNGGLRANGFAVFWTSKTASGS
jgi:hypothetical protein